MSQFQNPLGSAVGQGAMQGAQQMGQSAALGVQQGIQSAQNQTAMSMQQQRIGADRQAQQSQQQHQAGMQQVAGQQAMQQQQLAGEQAMQREGMVQQGWDRQRQFLGEQAEMDRAVQQKANQQAMQLQAEMRRVNLEMAAGGLKVQREKLAERQRLAAQRRDLNARMAKANAELQFTQNQMSRDMTFKVMEPMVQMREQLETQREMASNLAPSIMLSMDALIRGPENTGLMNTTPGVGDVLESVLGRGPVGPIGAMFGGISGTFDPDKARQKMPQELARAFTEGVTSQMALPNAAAFREAVGGLFSMVAAQGAASKVGGATADDAFLEKVYQAVQGIEASHNVPGYVILEALRRSTADAGEKALKARLQGDQMEQLDEGGMPLNRARAEEFLADSMLQITNHLEAALDGRIMDPDDLDVALEGLRSRVSEGASIDTMTDTFGLGGMDPAERRIVELLEGNIRPGLGRSQDLEASILELAREIGDFDMDAESLLAEFDVRGAEAEMDAEAAGLSRYMDLIEE